MTTITVPAPLQMSGPVGGGRTSPAAQDTGVTTELARLTHGALAQLLFACPLQPSARPSAPVVQAALVEQYLTCRGDLTRCLDVVAREAGDRPDSYVTRMRWALRCTASLPVSGAASRFQR